MENAGAVQLPFSRERPNREKNPNLLEFTEVSFSGDAESLAWGRENVMVCHKGDKISVCFSPTERSLIAESLTPGNPG